MNEQIKAELHQLIDQCNNDILLEEAKALLESTHVTDWWNDPAEGDKNMTPVSGLQQDIRH